MTGSEELQPGDTLGGYQLESVLGEGGMGLVFRARRVDDGEEVALKVLKLALGSDFLFQQRFRQEARAAAEVDNPHLVPIFEAAEAEGRPYLARAYVTGGSLTDRLKSGPLPPSETVGSSPTSQPGSTHCTRPGSSIVTSSPRTSSSATKDRRC